MDPSKLPTLIDGIFSKSLQVRRMLLRGEREALPTPLAEVVVLARELEQFVTSDQLAAVSEGLAAQRWHKPTVELSVSEGYAAWAKGYDAEVNPLVVLEEPAVLDLIGDVAGKDVLDAACGTGRYAVALAQAGARVVGIDQSEEMLAAAAAKRDQLGLSIDLRRGSLTSLPFPDSSFDLALCALVLCHLPELAPAAKEVARVLRSGGRLIVSDFHPFCVLIGWPTLFRRPEATYCIENFLHLTQDYCAALQAAGLEIAELREAVVDEALLPVFSETGVERFRGWPVLLIISAVKGDPTSEG